jgi:hypothetical protein
MFVESTIENALRYPSMAAAESAADLLNATEEEEAIYYLANFIAGVGLVVSVWAGESRIGYVGA